MGPILNLFGCTDISKPFDPDSKDWQKEFILSLSDYNAMPLIAPITVDEAAALYPNTEYMEANARYFESQEPLVDFKTGDTQTRDNIDFQEYLLTHTSTTPQPVYAITTGYLYYLTAGQSVAHLLAGTQVKTGETILVLLPLPTTVQSWKDKHPAKQVLPDQFVYLDIEFISDTCTSDTDLSEPCLKNLVRKTATRKYYEKIYSQYDTSGTDLPAENWEDDFIRLFKQNPEIPLVVQGGAQIGWTKAVSETDATQSIKMFFSFAGLWNGAADDTTRPFFTYHKRYMGLAGHPLVAKLLQQTVRAGTIDILTLEGITGGRSKGSLTISFQQMMGPGGAITNHPLAINPDQHPARLIVPKIPDPFPVIPNLTLREDQKFTWLKISNPLGLTISIADVAPEVSISPAVFQEKEQVLEIKLVGALPANFNDEVTIRFIAQDASGLSSEAFKLVLTFMDFHAVPIKFYQLFNAGHHTDIDEQKLREVISYANEILGRQTNVYIYPLEEEGVILHRFEYTDGDLGDPITASVVLPGFDGLEDVWQQMRSTVVRENIRVLFLWDQETGGDAIGAAYTPPASTWWELIVIDTKEQATYDASASQMAPVLVHELGHWFSTTFIYWGSYTGFACSGEDKHFDHGECPGGDWTLHGNIMTPNSGPDKIWISYNQAKVFNTYAKDVLP
jgi:hypothetical protein